MGKRRDASSRLNNICVLYVLERAKLCKQDTIEKREDTWSARYVPL